MTVEAPILFRPRPVGSSARSGDWELGAADITVRLPLADGCDDVPERLLVDPLHGFSPS